MKTSKGVIDSSLPLADIDQSWDSGEAIKAVKDWASDKDGNINFSKYKKAFFYVDDGGGDKQGDYHLPFATVIGGELKAVWDGVAAAMAALNGARNSEAVPAGDREDVYHEICTYYKRFDKEPPELKKMLTREVGEHVSVMMSLDPTTVKDLGDGVFEATVTTADVDRMNESIDTQGLDPSTWEKTGMPVLYGHDYQGLPIGKGLSFKQYKQKFTSRFQLAVKEYPFAATVAAMIKGGYLNAVSIGGVVRQWSDDYSTIVKMEMVEFSVVPVPANPSALITGRSLEQVTGKSVKQISEEYHEFIEKTVADKVKDLDNSELVRHIDTLEKLLAILKATAEKQAESKPEREVIKLTLKKSANEMARTSEQIIKIVKAKE